MQAVTNYIMPTSLDMPKIKVDIVDSYAPTRHQGQTRAAAETDYGGLIATRRRAR